MADALGPVAAAYGVLMAVSPLLQIRRMLQTRSSADVSIGYLAVIEVGFALWVVYGLSLPNLALAIPNGVAVVVGMVTIVIALWLRRQRSAA
jgi:MtN3 and saliva related transmembrane protein